MEEPIYDVVISQTVAILIDGNNIELGLKTLVGDKNALIDFDSLIPKLLDGRGLKRLIYFREGTHISSRLAERLLTKFHGSVVPCYKSADIPLTIRATQIATKVDTIIIMSGDSDYVELVRHLKGEGVRVEVAAIEASTAQILIDEVEHFTPITEEDCYILKPTRKVRKSKKRGKVK
ncbi:MAG: NYN domain-containing protein [Saprospiraceae bacterium]|nr:NYN domain-containing protein [Saprospiraceae bacterium]